MTSCIEDEEKLTKYFLFTLMSEKKLISSYVPELSCYKIGSVIGKSSFASAFVYASLFYKTNELVAIKKYNAELLSVDDVRFISQEIRIVNQLKNPFVLSSLVSFVTGSEIITITPLKEYGSCSDLIRNHFRGGLPETILNFILKDVVRALDFIHGKGIIHRAVKGSHILLGSDGHAMLTGFRYAFKKNTESNLLSRLEKVFEFPTHSVANLNWLSPDILQQNLNGYNEKSDIYSLGITLCELANGHVPFKNTKLTLMMVGKIDGFTPVIYDSSTVDQLSDSEDEDFVVLRDFYLSRKLSKFLHSFKDMCCTIKPEVRPDTRILLLHPLFSRIDKRRKLFSDLISPAVPISEKNFTVLHTGVGNPCAEENINITENSFDWMF